MNQRISSLFDEFIRVPLTRQEFTDRPIKLAGGVALALTTLSVLEPTKRP